MSAIKCPQCSSTQLTANKKGFSAGKAVAGAVLTGGIGLLGGFIGSQKVTITCLSCGNKFKPGEGDTSDPEAQQAEQQKSYKAFVFFAIQVIEYIESIEDKSVQTSATKDYLLDLQEKLEGIQQELIEINDKKETATVLQRIEKNLTDIEAFQPEYEKTDFAELERLIEDYDKTIKANKLGRRPREVEEIYPGRNVPVFLFFLGIIGAALIVNEWAFLGWLTVGISVLGIIVNLNGGVAHKKEYQTYLKQKPIYEEKKKKLEDIKANHPLHNFSEAFTEKHPELIKVQEELKSLEEKHLKNVA